MIITVVRHVTFVSGGFAQVVQVLNGNQIENIYQRYDVNTNTGCTSLEFESEFSTAEKAVNYFKENEQPF